MISLPFPFCLVVFCSVCVHWGEGAVRKGRGLETESHCVAQGDLKLTEIYLPALSLPSAGIAGHHVQLFRLLRPGGGIIALWTTGIAEEGLFRGALGIP